MLYLARTVAIHTTVFLQCLQSLCIFSYIYLYSANIQHKSSQGTFEKKKQFNHTYNIMNPLIHYSIQFKCFLLNQASAVVSVTFYTEYPIWCQIKDVQWFPQ